MSLSNLSTTEPSADSYVETRKADSSAHNLFNLDKQQQNSKNITRHQDKTTPLPN